MPGYAGVRLGPAGSRTLALFFADNEQASISHKVLAAAVDMQTGAVIWKNAGLAPGEVLEFAADAERLYLLSGRTRQVSAWRWDTGRRVWAAHAMRGLVAQDGRVVWVAYDGYLTAADGATGRKLWDHGFAPRDEWTPVATALGSVYVFSGGSARGYGCVIAVTALGLGTGAVVRKEIFSYVPCQYVFDYLRWSPRAQLFYGQDGIEGAGVHGREVRVIKPDLSPVWGRGDIRDCQVAGNVLVCKTFYRLETGGYARNGKIGMDLATGRPRWQRTEPDDADDQIVGEWNGTVVVMRPKGEAPNGLLMGLQPRGGHTLWSLALPVAAAGIYGDVLVAALEQRGQPARAVAYRVPRCGRSRALLCVAIQATRTASRTPPPARSRPSTARARWPPIPPGL